MKVDFQKIQAVDTALVMGTFGVILYLFFPTLREIALICWNDDDYSHGLLLPIVGAYMLWDQKEILTERLNRAREALHGGGDNAQARSEKSWFLPELVLLFGLLFYFLGAASGISYACWIAFFPTVLAATHLLFGRTAMWCLAPPVLLLFMAKPLPDSIVVRLFWPLQVLAARVSKITLELFDVPVYLSGNIIEIPQMRLLVEEACSGMRSVMALLTLSLIVLYFVPLRWVSKILLVIASVGIAIVLNVFRVALTGLLAHFYDPSTATGFFHTFSGMMVFVVGLPLLYGIGVLLTRAEAKLSSS